MVKPLIKPALGLIKYSARALRKAVEKAQQGVPIEPGSAMMKVVQKGKSSTVNELLGDKAYGRLMGTLDINNTPIDSSTLRRGYNAFIKATTGDTSTFKVPIWSRFKEYATNPIKTLILGGQRGSALAQGPGKVWIRPGMSLKQIESTAAHEFDHIAKLNQPSRSFIQKYDGKSGELEFMAKHIFGSNTTYSKYPAMRPMKFWEKKYLEKIKPHFTEQGKTYLKDDLTRKIPFDELKGGAKTAEYVLRPRELSARATQIRKEMMEQGLTRVPKLSEAKGLLKKLLKAEYDWVDRAGIQKMVDKLWSVAPIGGLLKYQQGDK